MRFVLFLWIRLVYPVFPRISYSVISVISQTGLWNEPKTKNDLRKFAGVTLRSGVYVNSLAEVYRWYGKFLFNPVIGSKYFVRNRFNERHRGLLLKKSPVSR